MWIGVTVTVFEMPQLEHLVLKHEDALSGLRVTLHATLDEHLAEGDVYPTAVHEPELAANNRFEAVVRGEEVTSQLREPPEVVLPADRAVRGSGRELAEDLDEAIANPSASPRVGAP